MADASDKPATDFLDQSEIDKLLAQTTETVEAKPILLRADGDRSAAAGESRTARQAGYSAPTRHSTNAPSNGATNPPTVGWKVTKRPIVGMDSAMDLPRDTEGTSAASCCAPAASSSSTPPNGSLPARRPNTSRASSA